MFFKVLSLRITILYLALISIVTATAATEPWFLPPLPLKPAPPSRLGNATLDKLIPRHLWIAVRDDKEPLNYQMPKLFERNKNWEVHICSNDAKDKFMNETFKGTSLLWAYNSISDVAGAAKADLWRYAVLWTYGGAYVDDDSDIGVPFDKMIEPLDSLIISYERNGFNANRCYIPRYHLSDFYAYRNESNRERKVFHHRCILNWAMVSAPRHAIIAATIENAVEIIRHEYLSDSVLRSQSGAFRWEAIMCATGPSLLTATARDIILKDIPGVTYKLAHNDFRDYGGKFKAVYVPVKNDPSHYMHKMTGKLGSSPNLLKSYLAEQPVSAQQLKEWQGAQFSSSILILDLIYHMAYQKHCDFAGNVSRYVSMPILTMIVLCFVVRTSYSGAEWEGNLRGGWREEEGDSQLRHVSRAELLHGGRARSLGLQDWNHRLGRVHAQPHGQQQAQTATNWNITKVLLINKHIHIRFSLFMQN